MLKRFWAWFLVFTMVLSMVPTTVLAETSPAANVAKVDDVEYATLDEAIEAAGENGTVVIIADGTYTLPAYTTSEPLSNITIKAGTDVTAVVDYSAQTGGLGTFVNVIFDGLTFAFPVANYTGFQHSGLITFNNCTLNGLFFSYGDMVFNTCTFNAPGSDVYG